MNVFVLIYLLLSTQVVTAGDLEIERAEVPSQATAQASRDWTPEHRTSTVTTIVTFPIECAVKITRFAWQNPLLVLMCTSGLINLAKATTENSIAPENTTVPPLPFNDQYDTRVCPGFAIPKEEGPRLYFMIRQDVAPPFCNQYACKAGDQYYCTISGPFIPPYTICGKHLCAHGLPCSRVADLQNIYHRKQFDFCKVNLPQGSFQDKGLRCPQDSQNALRNFALNTCMDEPCRNAIRSCKSPWYWPDFAVDYCDTESCAPFFVSRALTDTVANALKKCREKYCDIRPIILPFRLGR